MGTLEALGSAPAEPEPTEKEMKDGEEGGGFEVLPEGDYLVEISDLEAREKHGDAYSWVEVVLVMTVREPVQYAGRNIKFQTIRLYAPNEPSWCKNKRIGILAGLGLVAKGDTKAYVAFDYRKLQGLVCVFELEHRAYEDKNGKTRIGVQGRGFLGYRAASTWDAEKAPAPVAPGNVDNFDDL